MFTSRSVRRFLSLMICTLMVLSLFPISALSEGEEQEEFEVYEAQDIPEVHQELETVELEIPAYTVEPEYPTLWVKVVDRTGRPMKDVLLELVLPDGNRAGVFSTDEYGIASCSLDGAENSPVAYIRRHQDDTSGYGPASPIAVAIDNGSLVGINNQTETGFMAENPCVITVFPNTYTVTLYPNGGSFNSGYETFEILSEVFSSDEPYGYLPTDRFETYRPSKAYENAVYVTPVLEGYEISGWYTEEAGGDPVIFDEYGNGTRLYAPKTAIYAHWQAIDYNIVIDSGIVNGSVTASSPTANIGDTVTLTVNPDSVRYELASLSVKQDDRELMLTALDDPNAYSFTMPAGNVTVSASFTEVTVDAAVSLVWEDEENRDGLRPDAVILTLLADGEVLKNDVAVTAESGWARTESALPKYSEAGTEISYLWAAQPMRGYTLLSETADGTTTLTFTLMPLYGITIDTDSNGTVLAKMGEAAVSAAYAGDPVTLVLVPEDNYEPDTLCVKQGEEEVEVITGEDGSASFIMPAGDVTVSVSFKAILYTVTINDTENGTVSTDKTDAAMGENVTLTVTPDPWYVLGSLSVTDADQTDIEISENSFIMPPADVEVSASFIEDRPAFATHSLVLGGELGINFFMDLPQFEGVDYTDSYMTFTVNDETQRDFFDANDADLSGNGFYGFTCTVNSIQMADEITAVFHYQDAGEEKTVSQSYTVETYLNALLASDEISDEVKALARSLLDYGYYSQAFLSDIGLWTIGTDHNGMTTRFTDSFSAEQIAGILGALADQEAQRDTNRNIQKITYSLYLDSKTSIYLYLQAAENYSGEIGVALDDQPVSAVQEADGRCRITIPDLSADELGEMHRVVITTDGEDPLTVQLSALSYVKACLEDESASDAMIDAMAALYNYYTASTVLNQAS